MTSKPDWIPQEGFIVELVRSLSRELCNPVTSIKTAVKLLELPNLKPSQRQHYLQVISEECDRQNRLIQSLVELTTLGDMKNAEPVPIVIPDFIPAIVSTFQPLAQEKGVMLAYTVPAEMPLLWSVPVLVRKIIVQLLDNALRATPVNGRIWVTAHCPDPTHLHLEIRDTGIGIPAADLPRIFDHFGCERILHQEDLSLDTQSVERQITGRDPVPLGSDLLIIPVLMGIPNPPKGGHVFVGTIPAVAKEKIRTVFIHRENI